MNVMTKPNNSMRRPLGSAAASTPKHHAFTRAAFDIVTRADATVATTSGWAAELSADSFGEFLKDLQPYSGGASRLIQQAIPANLSGHAQLNYPVRVGSPSATPSWVSEGGAIPLKISSFSNVEIGPARKVAALIMFSNELGKRSDAFQIFSRMLREEMAAQVDGAFFSTDAGSASVHVGLLNGVTATTSSTSGAKADLSALASAVTNGGSGNVTFITTPSLFAQLQIVEPAIAASIDIVASAALPSGRVVACDAASLLVAFDAPQIESSKNATVHMSDAAAELVTAGGVISDPVRSAFQSDSTALRVIQSLAWAKSRSGAVQYLDGANWYE